MEASAPSAISTSAMPMRSPRDRWPRGRESPGPRRRERHTWNDAGRPAQGGQGRRPDPRESGQPQRNGRRDSRARRRAAGHPEGSGQTRAPFQAAFDAGLALSQAMTQLQPAVAAKGTVDRDVQDRAAAAAQQLFTALQRETAGEQNFKIM